jgi:hypothetical protein
MRGHILIQIPEDSEDEFAVYLSDHASGDSTSGDFSDILEALDWANGWFNDK